jgi:hypothetical protein
MKCRSVVVVAVAFLFASGTRAAQSVPALANKGLAVSVQPTSPVFEGSRAIELEVTFHNVSGQPYRLPARVERLMTDLWRLQARDASTGVVWTGVAGRRGCARVDITPDFVLRPGENTTSRVQFDWFGFVEGTMDQATAYQAVRKIMDSRCGGSSNPENLPRLPAGTYSVTLDVDFAESYAGDRQPIPVWSGEGSGILSSPPFTFSIRH